MSEKSEAKRDGAVLQKNSGRGTKKGDAIWLFRYIVDYKEVSKSFTVNKKVWAKACTDAIHEGLSKYPLIKIILGEGNNKVRLALVEESHIKELNDEIDRLEEKVFELECELGY